MAAGAGSSSRSRSFVDGSLGSSDFQLPNLKPVNLEFFRIGSHEDFISKNLEDLEKKIRLNIRTLNLLTISIGEGPIPLRSHSDDGVFWKKPKRLREGDDDGLSIKWRFEFDEPDSEGGLSKKEIVLEGALQVLFFLKMLLNNQYHSKTIPRETYLPLRGRICDLMSLFFEKMILLENTPTTSSSLGAATISMMTPTPFNQGIFFISVGLLQWMLLNKQTYGACETLIMSLALSVEVSKKLDFRFNQTRWSLLATQQLLLSPHVSIALQSRETETPMTLIEFAAREQLWIFLGWVMEKIVPLQPVHLDDYTFRVGGCSILGLFLKSLKYKKDIGRYVTVEEGYYPRQVLLDEILKILLCKFDFIYSKRIAEAKAYNPFLIPDLIQFCFEAHSRRLIEQSCSLHEFILLFMAMQSLATDAKGDPEVSSTNFNAFVQACISEATSSFGEEGRLWCVQEFMRLRDIDVKALGAFIEQRLIRLVQFIEPKTVSEEIEEGGCLFLGLRGLQKAVRSSFAHPESEFVAPPERKTSSAPAKGSPSRRVVGLKSREPVFVREEGSLDRIAFLEHQLEECQCELSAVKRERDDHKARVEEAEKLAESRESMIQGLKRKVEELAARLTETEKAAAVQRKKQSTRTGKPKAGVDPAEHATLKAQFDRGVEKAALLEAEIQAKEQEVLGLKQKNSEKEVDKIRLQQALAQVNLMLAERERDLGEALAEKSIMDNLRKELSSMYEKLRQLQLEKSVKESALIEGERAITQLRRTSGSLSKQVSALAREVTSLKEEVTRNKAQVEVMSSTLREKESQLATFRKQKAALEQDVGLLREQVYAMTFAIKNPKNSVWLSERLTAAFEAHNLLLKSPTPIADAMRARGTSASGAGSGTSGSPDSTDSLLDFSEL
jgi:hypothetical protein